MSTGFLAHDVPPILKRKNESWYNCRTKSLSLFSRPLLLFLSLLTALPKRLERNIGCLDLYARWNFCAHIAVTTVRYHFNALHVPLSSP